MAGFKKCMTISRFKRGMAERCDSARAPRRGSVKQRTPESTHSFQGKRNDPAEMLVALIDRFDLLLVELE